MLRMERFSSLNQEVVDQDCQLLLAQKIGGPLWGCIQANPSMLRMAWLFCFHPSLKQALFGVETKNPDQFPGRDLLVRMKGLEPSRRSTSA